jgi:hypothetical protein
MNTIAATAARLADRFREPLIGSVIAVSVAIAILEFVR